MYKNIKQTIHPIQNCLFVLIMLLLIFGKIFSKFNVYGPLHLYDLLFGLLILSSIVVLIRNPEKIIISYPIIAIIILSLIYLFTALIYN